MNYYNDLAIWFMILASGFVVAVVLNFRDRAQREMCDAGIRWRKNMSTLHKMSIQTQPLVHAEVGDVIQNLSEICSQDKVPEFQNLVYAVRHPQSTKYSCKGLMANLESLEIVGNLKYSASETRTLQQLVKEYDEQFNEN